METPKTAHQRVLRYLHKKRVMRYLGDKTDVFFSKIENRLEKYTLLWQLHSVNYMLTDTVNMLFSCESDLYGSCVLKMCIPGPVVATEIHCLSAYNGKSYCKLFAYDLADDVLLLERVTPGTQLRTMAEYQERAKLIAQIIKDMHIPWGKKKIFPTYRTWLEKMHKAFTFIGGLEDMLSYLDLALKFYNELRQPHRQNCLLHGDLHAGNLLLNKQGNYTIIDPKGVVGAPVMEIARSLVCELPCSSEKIFEMVDIMSPITGFAKKDILKSMFVDTVLVCSGNLGEYFPTKEAFHKKKQEMIEICGFVYEMLKKDSIYV